MNILSERRVRIAWEVVLGLRGIRAATMSARPGLASSLVRAAMVHRLEVESDSWQKADLRLQNDEYDYDTDKIFCLLF